MPRKLELLGFPGVSPPEEALCSSPFLGAGAALCSDLLGLIGLRRRTEARHMSHAIINVRRFPGACF